MEHSKELKKFTINLDESWDLSDWLKQKKPEEKNLSLDIRTTKNEIDFEFTLDEKPIAFFKFTAERLLEVLKKGTETI